MSDLQQQLSALLRSADIRLTDQQKQQLTGYVEMLHKWNKAYNLTSVRQPEQMLVRHIMDSIVVEPHLTGRRFIDVGTGPASRRAAGDCPPDSHFVLLDSLGKRVRFLKQVQHELGLSNIEPVQSRVEEYQSEPFDGVISRAFASLDDMLSWCHHLPVPETGRFCTERQCAGRGINPVTGGISRQCRKLVVPQLDEQRHLVILKAN